MKMQKMKMRRSFKSFFHYQNALLDCLKMKNDVTHIYADSTSKMLYLGYPMLMIGTSDMSKAYQPNDGLRLCLYETGDDYAFCFESIRKPVVIYLG